MGKGHEQVLFLKNDVKMANRHMKKCVRSIAIWEMHIYSTLRFHLSAPTMAITQKLKQMSE